MFLKDFFEKKKFLLKSQQNAGPDLDQHSADFSRLTFSSGSKLFDTLIVFLKDFFAKKLILKSQQMTIKA